MKVETQYEHFRVQREVIGLKFRTSGNLLESARLQNLLILDMLQCIKEIESKQLEQKEGE